MSREMQVFINGRFLTQKLSGVQRYALEIVRAMDKLVGDGQVPVRFTLLVPPNAPHANLRFIEQVPVGRFSGHLWDQFSFARAARSGSALCLANTGSILHKQQIVVIHDAAVQRYPHNFSRAYVAAHRVIDAVLARRSLIATVSAFSRGELAEVLKIPSDRIVVAPNGSEHLQIASDISIMQRLGLSSQKFFMTLGSKSALKNINLVMQALARLNNADVKLVLVGDVNHAVFSEGLAEEYPHNVVRAGRLEDAEIAGLMQHASALIFPSIYEGFGIPPLEAFANGCPVLASTAGAVLEVCGNAAQFFDPEDDEALADLMSMVMADDGRWRDAMVERGKARLPNFTWEASARILIDAMSRSEHCHADQHTLGKNLP